jgi:hypothetical protein
MPQVVAFTRSASGAASWSRPRNTPCRALAVSARMTHRLGR